METHCYYCEEMENLDVCRRCMKMVCPQHRWGTGSLSDGYYCLSRMNEECGVGGDGLTQFMGRSKVPKRTLFERLPRLSPGWELIVMMVTALLTVIVLQGILNYVVPFLMTRTMD